MGHRGLKQRLQCLLAVDDPHIAEAHLAAIPARRAVNPLFSFLYSTDETLKWRAVEAMGQVVAGLASRDVESARVVMRRLMWNLNDESGGIGWGSPEAMGEIMARSDVLAQSHARILVSYLDPQGNFLEHPLLQRGLLWGVGRLAYARSELMAPAQQFLKPFLEAEDPHLRGLAVWITGAVKGNLPAAMLPSLKADCGHLTLYSGGELNNYCVAQLVQTALQEQT